MPSATARFREMHGRDVAFLLPNPWDAGTARVLEFFGFEALATTSAGLAHSLGRPDGNRAVSRHEALTHSSEIVAATDLPVNADLERGYGDSPEEVAETVRLAVSVGLAGCSIEDATGDDDDPVYDAALATERIAAAVEAAGEDLVLTARAENYLHGRPDLADTIERLQAYQEVGAEVLYAPGLPDLAAMTTVVAAVDRPVNVLADPRYTVAELAATGAKRISLGSMLSRAAFGAVVAAARELLERGTFDFAWAQAAGDLDALFTERSD